MAWVSITIDTLYEAKIAIIVDLCDSLLLKENQANRAAGIIQGRVDYIRRKVASCRRNRLDQDLSKIPDGLKDIAVTLIMEKLKGALEMDLTEDERSAVSRAERDLNRVANCDDVVDQPDDPVPSSETMQGGIAVQAKANPRTFNAEKLSGL